MSNIKEKYNQSSTDHLYSYRGYAGYEKGLSEMMNSFYDAYPEYKNKVALVNLKALEEDRAAELDRLGELLGTTDIEGALDAKISSGEAFTGFNDQGEKIAAVAAWSIHHKDESQLDFNQNYRYTKVAIHELAHAIDYMKGSLFLDQGILEGNYMESYADSFRVALSVLHGHDEEGSRILIAGYDYRQLVNVADRYDNGVALHQVYTEAVKAAEDLPASDSQSSFFFQHWKKAQSIADAVRERNIGRHSLEPEAISREQYNQHTRRSLLRKLDEVINHNVSTDYPQLILQGENEVSDFKDSVRSTVSRLDLQDYEAGQFVAENEQDQMRIDIAYQARLQMNDWLKDRVNFIPDAARILASSEYIRNKEELIEYEPPEYDVAAFFVSAVQSYLNTGDSEDYRLAEYLQYEFDEVQSLSHLGYNNISIDDLITRIADDPEYLNKTKEQPLEPVQDMSGELPINKPSLHAP